MDHKSVKNTEDVNKMLKILHERTIKTDDKKSFIILDDCIDQKLSDILKPEFVSAIKRPMFEHYPIIYSNVLNDKK